MIPKKNPFASSTVWFNIIMAVGLIVDMLNQIVALGLPLPEWADKAIATVLVIGNTILRFRTQTKISFDVPMDKDKRNR